MSQLGFGSLCIAWDLSPGPSSLLLLGPRGWHWLSVPFLWVVLETPKAAGISCFMSSHLTQKTQPLRFEKVLCFGARGWRWTMEVSKLERWAAWQPRLPAAGWSPSRVLTCCDPP